MLFRQNGLCFKLSIMIEHHRYNAYKLNSLSGQLDPPINSRNWIPCIELDHVLQWIKCENYFGQKTDAFPLSSRPCAEVPLAAAVTNSLSNTNVEHLWDSTFFWELLTTLCCHKINWIGQLRGFISGIMLNRNNPNVAQSWISHIKLKFLC